LSLEYNKKAAEEDKELAWRRLFELFGTPVGNMRYTVLAYFYMDCQSKVNVAICIAAGLLRRKKRC